MRFFQGGKKFILSLVFIGFLLAIYSNASEFITNGSDTGDSVFDKAYRGETELISVETFVPKEALLAIDEITKSLDNLADEVVETIGNDSEGKDNLVDGFRADSAYEAMSSGAVDDVLSKMDIEEYLRLEELGESMYDGFRAMDDDFIKIAENTEFSFEEMKSIKEHLFIKEHKFSDGSVRKFDANYWQAEAWDRLIKGTPEPSDITLLNHELFELKYMSDNNVVYEVAHAKANELFNWSVEVFGK